MNHTGCNCAADWWSQLINLNIFTIGCHPVISVYSTLYGTRQRNKQTKFYKNFLVLFLMFERKVRYDQCSICKIHDSKIYIISIAAKSFKSWENWQLSCWCQNGGSQCWEWDSNTNIAWFVSSSCYFLTTFLLCNYTTPARKLDLLSSGCSVWQKLIRQWGIFISAMTVVKSPSAFNNKEPCQKGCWAPKDLVPWQISSRP